MSPRRAASAALAAGLWLVLAAGSAVGANKGPSSDDCQTCHAERSATRADGKTVFVDAKALAGSVHGEAGLGCVDCHGTFQIEEIPHKPRPAAVDCLSCHDGAPKTHVFHPDLLKAAAGEGKPVASCTDCHGRHNVVSTKDPTFRFAGPQGTVACESCHKNVATHFEGSEHGKAVRGAVAGAPTCLKCHEKPITKGSGADVVTLKQAQEQLCLSCHLKDPAVRARVSPRAGFIESYEKSVHGMALHRGNPKAPTCIDCHGSHDARKGFDTSSLVNKMRVKDVCQRCHEDEAKLFASSTHGMALAKGNKDAPACTDCHGEHGILSPKNPESSVAAANVSARVCTPCHASLKLNQKYDLPQDRTKTFADSFHGLASQGGVVEVANCASCHGAHDILPSSNPASRVNHANMAATCGAAGCHPGANERFASGSVHVTTSKADSPILYWIATLYVILIVVTIGGMLAHNALDFLKKTSHRFAVRRGEVEEEPASRALYVRMTLNERLQHGALMVSFTLLVITGFMLRFPDAWWVQAARRVSGSLFDLRSLIHRASAVVMTLASLWHLGYITLTATGRRLVKDLWWTWQDLRDPFIVLKYNLGLSKVKARFDRFCYIEKAEYWALVWGTLVMTATGAVMWFDNTFIGLFTKLGYDISRTVHYYEAWLATLAILVWHLYFVMFNPDSYPMNMSWLTGKLSEREMAEEHPLELERLKAEKSPGAPEPKVEEKKKSEGDPTV